MRTETTITKIFTLDELSDTAKEKALYEYGAYGVDFWWEPIYEDAEAIGIKITSFDEVNIEGDYIESAQFVVRAIRRNHGESTVTYALADALNIEHILELEKSGDHDKQLELEDTEAEFLNDILEDYRVLLKREYEFLTSEEAFQEASEVNKWEYLEDGTLY